MRPDGLDDLRLLGNDAAHIESKEFDAIGQEEVEIGIEFTKEVLKGRLSILNTVEQTSRAQEALMRNHGSGK
jgi:hypothetical protein